MVAVLVYTYITHIDVMSVVFGGVIWALPVRARCLFQPLDSELAAHSDWQVRVQRERPSVRLHVEAKAVGVACWRGYKGARFAVLEAKCIQRPNAEQVEGKQVQVLYRAADKQFQ